MGLIPSWGDLGYYYASSETRGANLSIFKRSEQSEVLGVEYRPNDPQIQDRAAVIFSSENVYERVKDLRIRGAVIIVDYEN